MKHHIVTSIVIMTIILSLPNLSQSIYAAPGTGNLYGLVSLTNELVVINPVTGAVTSGPIQILHDAGTPGLLIDDFILNLGTPSLAADSTGTLYLGTGSGTTDLYIVNPTTGEAAFQCSIPAGFGAVEGLAFDSNDNLFASLNLLGGGTGGGTDLVQIDTSCNIINGPFPFGFGGMGGLAFDAFDNLYGSTTTSNLAPGQLFTINTANGVPTPVAGPFDQSGGNPITLTGGVASLQFDCTGVLFGGTGKGGQIGQSDLVSINLVSGAASVVGLGTNVPFTLGGLAFDQTCSVGVGGELLPIDTTSLLVAGAQTSASWMIALAASIVGIGALIVKKKFN